MAQEYQDCPETDGELLPVVDWDDREIGQATRREIHAKNLMHRAVHVILVKQDGRFLISRRSTGKDRYPGWWDISVGGHVGPGEAYVETAIRECQEEMGITGVHPELVTIFPPSITNGWEHIHLFFCRVESEPVPNSAEVSEIRWTTQQDFERDFAVDDETSESRFTPSGYHSIEKWLRLRKK